MKMSKMTESSVLRQNDIIMSNSLEIKYKGMSGGPSLFL